MHTNSNDVICATVQLESGDHLIPISSACFITVSCICSNIHQVSSALVNSMFPTHMFWVAAKAWLPDHQQRPIFRHFLQTSMIPVEISRRELLEMLDPGFVSCSTIPTQRSNRYLNAYSIKTWSPTDICSRSIFLLAFRYHTHCCHLQVWKATHLLPHQKFLVLEIRDTFFGLPYITIDFTCVLLLHFWGRSFEKGRMSSEANTE